MKISRLFSSTLALAGLAVVGTGAAQAQSITPVFINVTPGSGAQAGQFIYNYRFDLASATGIRANQSYVTYYDFDGITGPGTFTPSAALTSLSTPGNFTPATHATGVTPVNVTPIGGDNPAILNDTFTYTGSDLANAPGSNPISLGFVAIPSTFSQQVGGTFTAFTTAELDSQFGFGNATTGATVGPNPSKTGFSTPEPGTLAMFVGMGVSGLAFARRRSRRK